MKVIQDKIERLKYMSSKTVEEFIRKIKKLPSDKPVIDTGKWYKTQKEHWLGWLSEYSGPGAYGRKTDKIHDAEYAYNHVVQYKMLIWIIKAAKINPKLIKEAIKACEKQTSLMGKSAAIRKHVPWDVLERAFW